MTLCDRGWPIFKRTKLCHKKAPLLNKFCHDMTEVIDEHHSVEVRMWEYHLADLTEDKRLSGCWSSLLPSVKKLLYTSWGYTEPTETKPAFWRRLFWRTQGLPHFKPKTENQAYRQDLLCLNSYTQVAMRNQGCGLPLTFSPLFPSLSCAGLDRLTMPEMKKQAKNEAQRQIHTVISFQWHSPPPNWAQWMGNRHNIISDFIRFVCLPRKAATSGS